jgi:hypothetical protein
MDRALAEMIALELRKLTEPINRLSELSENLESGTGEPMRQHLGKIMFEIEDIWRPIIREFPNLDRDF